jgi:hypothetical protein
MEGPVSAAASTCWFCLWSLEDLNSSHNPVAKDQQLRGRRPHATAYPLVSTPRLLTQCQREQQRWLRFPNPQAWSAVHGAAEPSCTGPTFVSHLSPGELRLWGEMDPRFVYIAKWFLWPPNLTERQIYEKFLLTFCKTHLSMSYYQTFIYLF